MLKFVRIKNFKMPGNCQMVDIQLNRDNQGHLVQTEKWEESVLLSGPTDTEPRKVCVPFTKTYTTVNDKKKSVMTVFEEINTLHYSSDEIQNVMVEVETEKLPLSTAIKSSTMLPAILEWAY